MGLQIRDERQRQALTGLSQAQFDSLLLENVSHLGCPGHAVDEGAVDSPRKPA
jgi:hypothetical protein